MLYFELTGISKKILQTYVHLFYIFNQRVLVVVPEAWKHLLARIFTA